MSMKPTPAAIIGATFFLVMFVASLVGAVLFVANGVASAAIPCVVMAAIIGYAIVANDLPRIWKPLLTGDKS
jgi:hypothetical protein